MTDLGRLHGVNLIAAWHLEALTKSILETLDATMVNGLPKVQMSHLQIGRDYRLQSSSDLREWKNREAFTAAAGTNQWKEVSGAESAAFYRLAWEP
jgi:hypothetical protein